VDVDPQRLHGYGLPIQQVSEAIQMANADAGARVLEMSGREYMIRGLGYLKVGRGHRERGARPRERAPRCACGRRPRADRPRHPPRRRRQGRTGDVVTGIVVMRHGENALQVIDAVKRAASSQIESRTAGGRARRGCLRPRAADPRGDRQPGLTILQVLLITALIASSSCCTCAARWWPSVTLPGRGARRLHRDAADRRAGEHHVAGRHRHRHRRHGGRGRGADRQPPQAPGARGGGAVTGRARWELVEASKEVGPAIFFSLLVVTVSFLPVFALEAQEGRLFKPLAWTKTLAMASAAVLAVT
jgi:copper/silver efflux system protein